MFITTAKKVSLERQRFAHALALELDCEFFPRGQSTIAQLKRSCGENEVIVVEEDALKLATENGAELFFHPNIAHIRISSLLNGKKDRLLEVAEVKEGDVVLDCTMGLATDSIVLSYAVGESGLIMALESVRAVSLVVQFGLQSYVSDIEELEDAMKRIRVIHEDHFAYLKRLPDKSVDIIYFDPMFRCALKTVGLAPIKEIANYAAIKIEAIDEARRVARKKIVFKEQLNSGEFERLRFQVFEKNKKARFHYGVIDLY